MNLPPVTAVRDGAPARIQLEVYVDLWVSDALTGGRVGKRAECLLTEEWQSSVPLWPAYVLVTPRRCTDLLKHSLRVHAVALS